jgi:alkanesulfonate monooxygenase SsuD/methylene tetrahydromethanopterin reductase-like flavin-dependent oxidoreductase (luciferase family)
MKFLATTLIDKGPHLLTGGRRSPQDRFRSVVDWAVYAEELGFDAFGVGGRHASTHLSSAPPLVLSYIAARTSRVRVLATSTGLGLLDPVRVAEDYATLDHLSGGRLELILGEGTLPRQPAPPGRPVDEMEHHGERFELVRRLWRGERITWTGDVPLTDISTQVRPLQEPSIPIWHGVDVRQEPAELAARCGDRVFSVNSFESLDSFGSVVRHYRRRFLEYGYDPAAAAVGIGSGGMYVTRTSQDALGTFRPYYHSLLQRDAASYATRFASLSESIEQGSPLVGSPQQVLEKIHAYHKVFGHQLLGVDVEGIGIPEPQQKASLELFFSEVAPTLRRELPSTVWSPRWPPRPRGPEPRKESFPMYP